MSKYLNYIRYLFICLTLLILSYSTFAISPQLLEQLKNDHIVDTTHTLSQTEIQNLKQENEEFFTQNHLDLKILMVPTIGEYSIESYAEKVFNTIQIGHKDLDNGLLLVIAKDDRKMRIEVGYGLEGRITDIQSGRIIRHTLAPYFQKNDYYTGILTAQREIGGIIIRPFQPLIQKQKESITITEPTTNIINYVIAFLWNIALSVVMVIHFSPVYKQLKQKNLKVRGAGLILLCIFLLHHIFTLILTNLSSIILFILYALTLSLTIKLNKHWSLYKNYISFITKYRSKLTTKKIISIAAILLSLNMLIGIWTLNPQIILFSMFLCFSPFILIIISIFLQILMRQYKDLYPTEYQHWFVETPKGSSTHSSDRYSNSSSSSSSSYSSSSFSSRDSSFSNSSSSSSSSSNQRDSGGQSGGGGASGSW